MLTRAVVLALLGLPFVCSPAPVRAGESIAPVSSYVVTTDRRTLRRLPAKGLITSAAGWRRVCDGLRNAPSAPDFASGQVCVLVVADTSNEAKSSVSGLYDGENQFVPPATQGYVVAPGG